jgi:ubiquinone/menaquinone biosynthesis C-methylase UbiE
MDDAYPHVWMRTGTAVEECLGFAGAEEAAPRHGPHNPHEFAQKLFAYEALQPSAAPVRADLQPEPFSLQWFLDIEKRRHSKHARWIPKLMEFAKHSGERLLGLGHGLGTDWVQYAGHGARVVVCSPSAAQLNLVRRNFAVRGVPGSFIHAQPARLPLDSASVDVACISSLQHGIDHPQGVIEEVYRVLKPGGKVLAVTPARYNVDFWCRACFFWCRWLVRQPRAVAQERYSARGLRRLFERFGEHRVHKRQLRRSEVPHVWRCLPLALLARMMGHVLILKAFKPLQVGVK